MLERSAAEAVTCKSAAVLAPLLGVSRGLWKLESIMIDVAK